MATALIVLDVQTGTVPKVPAATSPTYLPTLSNTISHARTAGVKIIFIRVCFRPSYPEISTSNPMFAKLIDSNMYLEGTPEVEIHPALGCDVSKGDIIVNKRRISGFAGSDLEVLLRGMRVQKVVLAGLVTSGTVLGTAYEASDRDFGVTVLRDLCKDREEELNEIVLEKVLAKVAIVQSSEEWLKGLV
ncbi:Isochorismatase hydrolase [Mollisia scopiformis]|uniref:Isochorismatase hydrolase n=1 Tax=Mollisia scopiformis TaxID=149040 RepID=A0A194XVW7_MOLSC|nr:Isochorismatase hydrolase [Mollisia scopiformis]KUJ24378.1 Isochorismatase hydrolase [Mollisia scopiformis]